MNPNIYQRESLASRLRKQLNKLNLDIPALLDGRSLDDLNADEVYVLAKSLPDFSKEKRLQAYKGVLQEAIEEGDVDSSSSAEILQQMRRELNITDEEHQTVLTELSEEDDWEQTPDLGKFSGPWKKPPVEEAAIDLIEVAAGKKSFESIAGWLSDLDDISEDDSNPSR